MITYQYNLSWSSLSSWSMDAKPIFTYLHYDIDWAKLMMRKKRNISQKTQFKQTAWHRQFLTDLVFSLCEHQDTYKGWHEMQGQRYCRDLKCGPTTDLKRCEQRLGVKESAWVLAFHFVLPRVYLTKRGQNFPQTFSLTFAPTRDFVSFQQTFHCENVVYNKKKNSRKEMNSLVGTCSCINCRCQDVCKFYTFAGFQWNKI